MRSSRLLVVAAVSLGAVVGGCRRVRDADGAFRLAPLPASSATAAAAPVVVPPPTPPASPVVPAAPRPTTWRARYFQISDG